MNSALNSCCDISVLSGRPIERNEALMRHLSSSVRVYLRGRNDNILIKRQMGQISSLPHSLPGFFEFKTQKHTHYFGCRPTLSAAAKIKNAIKTHAVSHLPSLLKMLFCECVSMAVRASALARPSGSSTPHAERSLSAVASGRLSSSWYTTVIWIEEEEKDQECGGRGKICQKK